MVPGIRAIAASSSSVKDFALITGPVGTGGGFATAVSLRIVAVWLRTVFHLARDACEIFGIGGGVSSGSAGSTSSSMGGVGESQVGEERVGIGGGFVERFEKARRRELSDFTRLTS
jgi:hypothetical protein